MDINVSCQEAMKYDMLISIYVVRMRDWVCVRDWAAASEIGVLKKKQSQPEPMLLPPESGAI
jgi:hypothetical protein